MITRRTLLFGTAGLAAGSVLTSCSRNAANALNVTLLEGAIPPEVLKQFRKQTAVNFQTQGQMQALFQQLQRWQNSPEGQAGWGRFLPWRRAPVGVNAQRLVSLGDYWLKSAIAQELIEPLALSDSSLEALPVQWQAFVNRDDRGQIAPDGQFWAAPYKVQALVIVYRQTAANLPFNTWSDLLNPALRQQIALPDHPNLVLGILQKIQTDSFNTGFTSLANSSTATPQLVEQLYTQLAEPFTELNQQVRTYDASTALKALINEDLQAVVAWSGDVVTALQRYRSLRAVVPEEGSLLSADMWVQPKGAQMDEAAQNWIDFCWETGPATQISVTGAGLSPVFLTEPAVGETLALPETLANSRLSAVAMQNSQPLLPLPDSMQAAYFDVWQQLRTEAG